MMLVLSVAPAALVAYMMICRLNERKRSIFDYEGWAFLFILGGSIWTFYKACSVGMSPTMGKQFLDIGIACISVSVLGEAGNGSFGIVNKTLSENQAAFFRCSHEYYQG